MEALALANEIRVNRARLRRDLKAGRVRVADLIAAPPAWLASMKVSYLLLLAPRVGQARVSRFLMYAKVAQAKTVGGLSTRQRDLLVALLNPKENS